jgi:hypothetical protein
MKEVEGNDVDTDMVDGVAKGAIDVLSSSCYFNLEYKVLSCT